MHFRRMRNPRGLTLHGYKIAGWCYLALFLFVHLIQLDLVLGLPQKAPSLLFHHLGLTAIVYSCGNCHVTRIKGISHKISIRFVYHCVFTNSIFFNGLSTVMLIKSSTFTPPFSFFFLFLLSRNWELFLK